MNIFAHDFNNLSDADKELLGEYFTGYPYKAAGYTLTANYVWRNVYCLNWEEYKGLILLAGSNCMYDTPKAVLAMPMTKNGKYDPKTLREAIEYAKERFDEKKIKFSMGSIPGHMIGFLEEVFPGEMEFLGDRDEDEYVYPVEKMIDLSGRALHKKRNHMNYFKKNFSYQARELTTDDFDKVMSLVLNLIDERQPDEESVAEGAATMEPEALETLKVEEDAIRENMKIIDNPRMFSIGVFIDEELVAFSLGERLTEDMAVAHFEKAKSEYRGLYQIVASEFCKILPKDIKYINREEDMGIENLRHAKESLRPVDFVRKFSAKFKI